MQEAFNRTAMLLGQPAVETLAAKHVAVFGLGGVGGHACEALARAGIGAIDVFDHDVVSESNLNRQLVALHSTIGQKKCDVMAARIKDINPDCTVKAYPVFYMPETADAYPFAGYDYVIDAVDTVTAKMEIIRRAKEAGVPVISCMGTGNKLHPEELYITDISKTSACPLARVMRRELKQRGIKKVPVVCSRELPVPLQETPAGQTRGKVPPGSVSFVPPAAGLMLAGAVVRGLLGID